MYLLGEAFYWGIGTVEDRDTGKDYLKKAAASYNDVNAQWHLGMILIREGNIEGVDYLFNAMCCGCRESTEAANCLYQVIKWNKMKGNLQNIEYVHSQVERLWNNNSRINGEQPASKELARAFARLYKLTNKHDTSPDAACSDLIESANRNNGYAQGWLLEEKYRKLKPDEDFINGISNSETTLDLYKKYKTPLELHGVVSMKPGDDKPTFSTWIVMIGWNALKAGAVGLIINLIFHTGFLIPFAIAFVLFVLQFIFL